MSESYKRPFQIPTGVKFVKEVPDELVIPFVGCVDEITGKRYEKCCSHPCDKKEVFEYWNHEANLDYQITIMYCGFRPI